MVPLGDQVQPQPHEHVDEKRAAQEQHEHEDDSEEDGLVLLLPAAATWPSRGYRARCRVHLIVESCYCCCAARARRTHSSVGHQSLTVRVPVHVL